MSKARDLTGDVFGRLTVVSKDEEKTKISSRGNYWLCQCSCGSPTRVVEGAELTRKNGTKSCGCLSKEKTIERSKKENIFVLSGDYGVAYTEEGRSFRFDIEDYDLIKNYYWGFDQSGYLISTEQGKELRVHRVVMKAKDGQKIDHINRERYDNRKENLRFISDRGNCININQKTNNKSGKTGVYYHKRDKLWIANIMIDGEQVEIIRTQNKNEAILKRLEAEKIHYGKYSPNYENGFKINHKTI